MADGLDGINGAHAPGLAEEEPRYFSCINYVRVRFNPTKSLIPDQDQNLHEPCTIQRGQTLQGEEQQGKKVQTQEVPQKINKIAFCLAFVVAESK